MPIERADGTAVRARRLLEPLACCDPFRIIANEELLFAHGRRSPERKEMPMVCEVERRGVGAGSNNYPANENAGSSSVNKSQNRHRQLPKSRCPVHRHLGWQFGKTRPKMRPESGKGQLTLDYDFVTAVAILEGWLDRYQSRLPKPRATSEAKEPHVAEACQWASPANAIMSLIERKGQMQANSLTITIPIPGIGVGAVRASASAETLQSTTNSISVRQIEV